MQASKKVPQLPTPSNTTTADLTDLAKGMRDLTAALRRFIEHLDSDSDYSEGVSEETRRELESEFFATRRGR